MTVEKEMIEELREIKNLLKLLLKINKIDSMINEIINTSKRKEIFELFDGNHNLDEITKSANITRMGLFNLIKDLEEAGLITVIIKGNTKYPKKIV